MQVYLEVFDDAEVVFEHRHPDDSPGGGTIMLAELSVHGSRIRCSDSYVERAWDFTPAVSLWVQCATDAEQDRAFAGLSEGGRVHMPLDDHGFGRFGWVEDRFGVSWQLVREAWPSSTASRLEADWGRRQGALRVRWVRAAERCRVDPPRAGRGAGRAR